METRGKNSRTVMRAASYAPRGSPHNWPPPSAMVLKFKFVRTTTDRGPTMAPVSAVTWCATRPLVTCATPLPAVVPAPATLGSTRTRLPPLVLIVRLADMPTKLDKLRRRIARPAPSASTPISRAAKLAECAQPERSSETLQNVKRVKAARFSRRIRRYMPTA